MEFHKTYVGSMRDPVAVEGAEAEVAKEKWAEVTVAELMAAGYG